MAQIPTPLTRSQLLGTMIDTFLSKYGLKSIKVGDPLLSTLETVSQSQLRASEQIFAILRGVALDFAKGMSLDRIGADELTPRLAPRPAIGTVTISDTSFDKISSVVFQGTPPVIVGATSVNVPDASSFPASGSIYIGRGSVNYEGPLAYTSISNPGVTGGNYWRINLSTSTTKYHNVGETVVLAQGGTRVIQAGTLCQTPQGPLASSVKYRVLYQAQIDDGETFVENVTVVADSSGVIGNVPAGAISEFPTPPFSGAAVTNNSRYSNGRNVERDEDYVERIRLRRRSRSLGTVSAIKSYSLGVEAQDENSTVLSNSVLVRQNAPATLYVDDGTGYEEKNSGIAEEILTESAFGGEQYFRVSQVPISKAISVSSLSSPFKLSSGGKLAFLVSDVFTEHTFGAEEFGSIDAATAYEVVASINSDAGLKWFARTVESGTKVAVFAKEDTNDDIQWTEASENDQNDYLGFSSEKFSTISLYKNSVLLSKDGLLAQIYTKGYGEWASLSGPQSLRLEVDGIDLWFGVDLASFTDNDFVNANTGYNTLGNNSLAAWAAVFNYRIPGITASVVGSKISLVSNRGRSDTASIKIVSESLVTSGMFYAAGDPLAESIGRNLDYTINRNTGELCLAAPLSSGDELVAGTSYTRAFLGTPEIGEVTFPLSVDAELWFSVDGTANVVDIGTPAGQTITITKTAKAWGDRQKYSNATLFDNAQVGDWLILWDSALSQSGAYRISEVGTDYVEFDVSAGTSVNKTLADGGIAIVRTSGMVQKVTLPYQTGGTPNTYTATSLADNIDLISADTSVYKTNYIRIRTNTYGSGGDIALVAQNASAEEFGLSPADYTENNQGHLASVESGNRHTGTPSFQVLTVDTGASLAPIFENWASDGYFTEPPAHYNLTGVFSAQDGLTEGRWGNPKNFETTIQSVTAGGTDTLTLRSTATQTWLKKDRAILTSAFTLFPDDTLSVLLNGDLDSGLFEVSFKRKLTPSTSTYGATNTFYDADNGGVSLSRTFGYGSNSFDFKDFAIWMKARAKVVQNATILWRYGRLGPDGNLASFRYALPEEPNASPTTAINARYTSGGVTRNMVEVVLGSGSLREGYTMPTGYYLGVCAPAEASGMRSVYYIAGLKIISYQRTANVVTARLEFPDAAITNSGIDTYGLELFNFVSTSGAPSGSWNLAGVTISEWVPASGIYDKIVFSNTGVDIALTTGNVGVIYFTPSGTASFIDGAPAVVQYDYLRAEAGSGLPTEYTGFTASVANVPATDLYHLKVSVPNFTAAIDTEIQYAPLTDPSLLKIFANANMSGTNLVAAINALDNPMATGTVLASGSSVIKLSSEEFATSSTGQTAFVDGINYVSTQTSPTLITDQYSFTFKNAIDAGLGAGCDWSNEEIYAVPMTVKNVVDWCNIKGITGISGSAEILRSRGGSAVQIASSTIGSEGSVQVQGGLANSADAALVGTPELIGNTILSYISKGDSDGLYSGGYVRLQNSVLLPKLITFDATTRINTWTSGGVITFDAGCATDTFTEEVGSSKTNLAVTVEKHGDFVALMDTGLGASTIAGGLGAIDEGDYILIETVSASQSGTPIDDNNMGLFRVLRVDNSKGIVWIENSIAVEQPLCDCDVRFFDKNSLVPGDTFRIDTDFFGETYKNVWTILEVGNDFTNDKQITVSMEGRTVDTYVDNGAVGATKCKLLRAIQGTPYSLIKQIHSVFPSEDENYWYMKFVPNYNDTNIGAAAGTVVSALDKLAFSTTINKGVDGYRYSIGLIQEVNKVIYGDPSNPSLYPGVVAAGAKLNIEGSLVKKIQMAFQIRTENGYSREVLSDKIKNSVSGYINGLGVGVSVSISAVVAEIQKIVGVGSVVVTSPVYNSSNDIILVQPYEIARVLNTKTDIGVVFLGQ